MNNNDLQSMGIGRAVIWRLCVALVIEDLKECYNSIFDFVTRRRAHHM